STPLLPFRLGRGPTDSRDWPGSFSLACRYRTVTPRATGSARLSGRLEAGLNVVARLADRGRDEPDPHADGEHPAAEAEAGERLEARCRDEREQDRIGGALEVQAESEHGRSRAEGQPHELGKALRRPGNEAWRQRQAGNDDAG